MGLEDTMNEQGKNALTQRFKKLCRKTVWLRLAVPEPIREFAEETRRME